MTDSSEKTKFHEHPSLLINAVKFIVSAALLFDLHDETTRRYLDALAQVEGDHEVRVDQQCDKSLSEVSIRFLPLRRRFDLLVSVTTSVILPWNCRPQTGGHNKQFARNMSRQRVKNPDLSPIEAACIDLIKRCIQLLNDINGRCQGDFRRVDKF